MECKVSELVKRGHDQAAKLKSSCGGAVAQLISDLATQLDCTALALLVMYDENGKLAAENAGLKDEISNITFMRDDDFFGSTQRAQEVMGRLVNVKTPATDAFLAEVRAQHGESICASLFEKANEYDARAKEVDCHTTDNRYRFAAAMFRGFAAQLRKGVQS